MKTLKLFIISLALLASHSLFSQVVQVNNNTALTNGNATFYFTAPSPPPPCLYNPPVTFLANSTGNVNTTSCSGLVLSTVQIFFDDPLGPCQPNPQAPVNLSPTTPNAVYIDCSGGPGVPYYFSLSFAGGIWLVTITN
jgi:hypothetical protein